MSWLHSVPVVLIANCKHWSQLACHRGGCQLQGAFGVKFMPKIRDCTPTFIKNYIMIFETPRRRYPNFCAWNALLWMECTLVFARPTQCLCYARVTHRSCAKDELLNTSVVYMMSK